MITAGPVCYRTLEYPNSHQIETYEKIGGYQVIRKIIEQKTKPETIIESLKQSGLCGKGGAAFPSGLKLSFMPKEPKPNQYLVCNSDEGEPGTSKDRFILSENPHQLLEGLLIAAYAIGASVAYNYLRGEFHLPFQRMEQALNDARKKGYIGQNIFGSSISINIHNVTGAGSYIVGEETAMLESLEGKRAYPRAKPPFPAVSGLYGCPTTINNTETIASIPVILEKGPQWYKNYHSENSGGTKIFCVSGHVNEPKIMELPLGLPFKDILEKAGGVRNGNQLKAVIPGGSSMKILPRDIIMNTDMNYENLKQAGSAIGTGAIIVLDETTCMVDTLKCLMNFYKHESCGQCTPCREGTPWIYRTIVDIVERRATISAVESLIRIANNIEGKTICAFGEAVAWPVTSFLKHFSDEFIYYIEHGHSMVKQEGNHVRK